MKYIVTDKGTGKELLNMEFTAWDDAVVGLRKHFPGGIKPDEIEVRVEQEDGLPPIPVTTEQLAKMVKTRKPRSDAGKTHSKAEPAKKVRNRGQFFVFVQASAALTMCKTREELLAYLETLSPENARIIQGRELKFERKVQFKLKLVS